MTRLFDDEGTPDHEALLQLILSDQGNAAKEAARQAEFDLLHAEIKRYGGFLNRTWPRLLIDDFDLGIETPVSDSTRIDAWDMDEIMKWPEAEKLPAPSTFSPDCYLVRL